MFHLTDTMSVVYITNQTDLSLFYHVPDLCRCNNHKGLQTIRHYFYNKVIKLFLRNDGSCELD